jgi:hypothetical protein
LFSSVSNVNATIVELLQSSLAIPNVRDWTIVAPNEPPVQRQPRRGWTIVEPNNPPIPKQPRRGWTIVAADEPTVQQQPRRGRTIVVPDVPPVQRQPRRGWTIVEPNNPPIPKQPRRGWTIVAADEPTVQRQPRRGWTISVMCLLKYPTSQLSEQALRSSSCGCFLNQNFYKKCFKHPRTNLSDSTLNIELSEA